MRAVGGAKSDKHLSAITNKTQTSDAVSLTVCSSESWTGYFIAGTAPSFSIKRCANPASNWALFIKRSSTNTFEKLRCFPGKTNCIHRLRNAGFFGKLNKIIFPSQPKTHFFKDILPELVPCSSAAGWSALTSVVYVSKSHDRKKLSETCTNPEVRFLPQKYSKWFF